MSKITLHRDDLERILEVVDKINPVDSMRLGAGYVTIHQHSKCEIGSKVDVILSTHLDGIPGEFTVSIIDEENW